MGIETADFVKLVHEWAYCTLIWEEQSVPYKTYWRLFSARRSSWLSPGDECLAGVGPPRAIGA